MSISILFSVKTLDYVEIVHVNSYPRLFVHCVVFTDAVAEKIY